MHRHWILLCTVLLVSGSVAPAWSEEPAGPGAVIDKAIKALGGAEKLARYRAVTAKAKGTFSGLGEALACTVVGVAQLPRQRRMQLDFEFLGAPVSCVLVLDGDHGWLRTRGSTEELDREQLAAAQEEAYAEWVSSLAPFRPAGPSTRPAGRCSLTALKEIKVNDSPAVGVKVAAKGHHDVELYFDKKSGLLVKSKTRGRDLRTGRDFEQETFYSAYKPFEGVQRPTRRLVQRDGKDFLDLEFTEVKLSEKVPDKEFARPAD